MSMSVGVCSHSDTEEVKTEGGDTIAYRCKGCTLVVAGVGLCDGCSKVKPLTRFVSGKRPRRYCNDDCRTQAISRKRKAEKEAR
jgi:hypothetical protein